jgi:hypothetical protein
MSDIPPNRCLARRGWTLRTWRKIHWSGESRFLLHVTDSRMRVWRHKHTAYTPRNIQPIVPYGGGSVMVWWDISHHCKLDLITTKHHAKRDRRCRSANSGRLMTLLDVNPDDFRRFLTVLVDRRLLGSQCCLSTGLVANGIV